MKWKVVFTFVFCLLMISPVVQAAPWTDTFENPVATDQVYLFMVDGGVDNVTFEAWAQAPHTNGFLGTGLWAYSWTIDIEQGDLLSASGNDFGTSAFWGTQGYFDINFSNNQNDFSFEYAYLLDGAIARSGTWMWDADAGAAAGAWNWSNDFTSTIPTPIGGTVWLLASGLLAVVGIRGRKRSIPD